MALLSLLLLTAFWLATWKMIELMEAKNQVEEYRTMYVGLVNGYPIHVRIHRSASITYFQADERNKGKTTIIRLTVRDSTGIVQPEGY